MYVHILITDVWCVRSFSTCIHVHVCTIHSSDVDCLLPIDEECKLDNGEVLKDSEMKTYDCKTW